MPPKAAETSAVPRLIPAAALSAALERFLMEFLDLEALSKLRVLSKGSAALSREAVRALSFFVAPTDQLAAARAVLLLPECERLQLLDLDPTPLIGLRLHFQLRDGLPGLIVRNAGTLRRLLLPQMFASLEATRAMAQCKLLTKFRCSGLLDFEGSGFEYTRALLAVLESCPSIVDVEAHKFVPSNSMNRVVEADPRAMWGLLSNGMTACRHASSSLPCLWSCARLSLTRRMDCCVRREAAAAVADGASGLRQVRAAAGSAHGAGIAAG